MGIDMGMDPWSEWVLAIGQSCFLTDGFLH